MISEFYIQFFLYFYLKLITMNKNYNKQQEIL